MQALGCHVTTTQDVDGILLGLSCAVLVTQAEEGYGQLEKVRKRFTKTLLVLQALGNKKRLDNLGLFSLQERRLYRGILD